MFVIKKLHQFESLIKVKKDNFDCFELTNLTVY